MIDKQNKEKLISNLVIIKGVLYGLLLLLIISAIMAVFSGFVYSLNLNIFNILMLIINALILGYIGYYIAKRAGRNGWLNGGLGGLIYMGFLILLGTFSIPISIAYIFLLLLIGLLIGSIGGIIGINF